MILLSFIVLQNIKKFNSCTKEHNGINDEHIDVNIQLSRVKRKPTFCICENKDADQLRGNCKADQRLCFCYIDSTIPLLSKFQASSHLL